MDSEIGAGTGSGKKIDDVFGFDGEEVGIDSGDGHCGDLEVSGFGLEVGFD